LARITAAAALVAAVSGAIQTGASAQNWPTRPITLIIPSSAGGPADIPARMIADHVRASLGQPLVIENIAGAGGSIAVTRVVRSAPDGYTVLMGSFNSNVVTGAVYNLPYDLQKDLEPVALMTSAPMWIVGRNTFPANSLSELTAWLKTNPEKATSAIVGVGTAAHVCGLHFQSQTGTRLRFVPYRGGGPAYQDLAAGHVDLMCAEASATRALVTSGKIKAFTLMSKERWPGLPTVPTAEEQGVKGLYLSFWHATWVPKGTPKDVIAKLNKAIEDALAEPDVTKRLTEIGLVLPKPDERSPAFLAAHHAREIAQWWPVVKAANIKAK
jgi:tripartite-type tricarboxylate transporter receptor subunit TctC